MLRAACAKKSGTELMTTAVTKVEVKGPMSQLRMLLSMTAAKWTPKMEIGVSSKGNTPNPVETATISLKKPPLFADETTMSMADDTAT